MKFNVMVLAVTAGLFWSAAILVVSCANLIWPGYGGAFLQFVASIYPGYTPGQGIGSVIIGTLYALVDATIGGAVFGWLYNVLSARFSAPAH